MTPKKTIRIKSEDLEEIKEIVRELQALNSQEKSEARSDKRAQAVELSQSYQ